MPTVPSVPLRVGGWDESAEKYKCCCRAVHVKTASTVIGWLHLACVLAISIGLMYAYAKNSDVLEYKLGDKDSAKYLATGLMLACAVHLLIVTMFLMGLQREKGCHLMPMIIVSIVALISNIMQTMHDFIWLMHDHRMVKSGDLLMHWVAVLLQAWVVSVLWRTYKYFNDKKVARQISDHVRILIPESEFAANDHIYKINTGLDDPPPYADTVVSDKVPLTADA